MKYLVSLLVAATLVACSTTSGWSKDDTVNAMRVGRTVAAAELQRAVDKGKIEPLVREGVLLVIDTAIDAYAANDDVGREAVLKAAVWKAINKVAELLANRGATEEAAEIDRAVLEHK